MPASQREDIFNRINSLSPEQSNALEAWVDDCLSDNSFCRENRISLTKPSEEQVGLIKAYVFLNIFCSLDQENYQQAEQTSSC